MKNLPGVHPLTHKSIVEDTQTGVADIPLVTIQQSEDGTEPSQNDPGDSKKPVSNFPVTM